MTTPPRHRRQPGTARGAARITRLTELARRIRVHAVHMTHHGKTAHLGSCLSLADILAVLYGAVMHYDPTDPFDPTRDRLIISKGHASAAVYAALAESGYLPPEELATHCQNGSRLCGHVSQAVPGVEASTGSLGHGLPIATGMAYAAKLAGAPHRVLAVLSDGECDEGSVWEAALFAAHHRLSALTVIIDYNKIQSLAAVAETLALEPLAAKWRSFGFRVREVNGHDCAALCRVLTRPSRPREPPLCVIAHTIKGKGVGFMEQSVLWHYRSPQGEEYRAALRELGEADHA